MRVTSKGVNKCKKEKYSVCTVCSLRGLRFVVTGMDVMLLGGSKYARSIQLISISSSLDER